MLLVLWLLLGCRDVPSPTCDQRGDDADCDGVPDRLDRCPESAAGAEKDAVGCTENQTAGCTVELLGPEDRAKSTGETLFAWNGDCDVYLLQFSEDPAFTAAATRTAVRTSAQEVVIEASEPHWRVVGGRAGSSTGYTTAGREIRWR